jgi:hypothetical protein
MERGDLTDLTTFVTVTWFRIGMPNRGETEVKAP